MTDLRITVTDSSTVITGAANVHRYDAPTTREIAGTVRSVLGPAPNGAQVHIAADAQRLRELAHALSDYDIELSTETLETLEPPEAPAPSVFSTPMPDDAPTDSFSAIPPERDSRSGTWIVAGVVAVVALVSAGTIWMFAGGGDAEPAAAEPVAEPEAGPDRDLTPPPGEAERTSISEKPTVRLEHDGLSVELPAGYALDAHEGMWRATGDDPNFRLNIAVEHLYQLPARTMAEQLIADIDADADLELIDTDGVRVTYLERAGDGSQTLWETWPSGADQLFIGCNSRHEPTVVQRATCRMALQSAEYKGADVGP